MTRPNLRVRWLVAALVVAAPLAVAPLGHAGAAAPPTIPPGYVPLVDDTGTITVTVPPTWSDVDTAPLTLESGSQLPQIIAAPNIESFRNTFDVPGVRYLASAFTADPQSLIDVGLPADSTVCTSLTVQPYSDPVFTGLVQVGTGCGTTGQATWNMVVASPADSSFTAILQVQAATPADTMDMAIVLGTFNVATGVPTPTVAGTPTLAPAPTVAPVPTVAVPTVAVPTVAVPTVAVPTVATVAPVTAVAPTVAAATVPPVPTVAATLAPAPTLAAAPTVAPVPTVAGTPTTAGAPTITITDDTGVLTVQVPATWSQTDTVPNDNGNPFISASPDLAAFTSADPAVALATQGLIYTSTSYLADPTSALSFLSGGMAANCTPGEVQPYDDTVFVGSSQIFTDCGGTGTLKAFIVASPADQSRTVTVIIQVQSLDDPAVNTIVTSFNVVA